jgi:hypothetical protein
MAYEPFTAKTAAVAIRRELDAGDDEFAFRMLVKSVTEFRQAIASGDSGAIERFLAAPESTGSDRWDTLLAACIGRECRLADIVRPGWTMPEPLDSFWFVDPLPMAAARAMQRTAPDLACVGIWLDHAAFEPA